MIPYIFTAMRMKYCKLFVYAVISSSLLVSCEQDMPTDISSADYIKFSVPQMKVERSSRSTFIENELPDGSSFGVMGYCVPYQNMTTNPDWNSGSAVWSAKRSNVHPDVFDNQKVTYSSGSCSYTNKEGQLTKWYNTTDNSNAVNPDDYRYTFFAYYPYIEDNQCFTVSTTNNSGKGAPIFKFTMPFSGTDNNTFLDDSQTPDAMLAVNYNLLRTGGNVNFAFSHIMVGLGFSLSNYNFAETDVITVNSIKLSGSFIKSLIVDFNKATNESGFFTYSDRYNGYFNIIDKNVTINPGETIEPQKHLLLLTDNVNGSFFGDVNLEINYIYNGMPKTATAGRPTDFKPQPGVKYTAQLSFVGETFILDFIAAENEIWENGGDSDITIQ